MNPRSLTIEQAHAMIFDESSDESVDLGVESDVSDSDVEPAIVEEYVSDSECSDVSTESENEDRNPCVAGRSWKYIQRVSKTGIHNIVRHACGPTALAKNAKTNMDAFSLFISDEIINIIVTCSNQRGRNKVKEWNEANTSGTRRTWKEVDAVEIRAFLGLLILMGRYRESREKVHDLWRTDTGTSRPIFSATMSRDRYLTLLSVIRFDDMNSRVERKKQDKLAPLREVTDIFVENCKKMYEASPFGTVDEELVKFRGRCPFKVYMPNKPGKYGIKIWMLCDATTFYCCNLQVYLGRTGDQREMNQGPRVVKELVSHWNNSGRNVTTDNFFTDITLAEDLLACNVTLLGTMRKNRKDLPKCLVNVKKRAIYSSHFLFTQNLTLVSYVPKKNALFFYQVCTMNTVLLMKVSNSSQT